MDNAGVYLITAAGDGYLDEATSVGRRIKSFSSDIPVAIATDGEPPDSVFDEQIKLKNPDYSTLDKTRYIQQSPFEKTLYLDTDVYVVDKEGIQDIFNLLDRFDFAAAHDPGKRLDLTRHYADPDGLPDVPIPDSFAWFNGGILAFRDRPNVQSALEQWEKVHREHMEYREIETMDQAALRTVLYESDLRIATLPPEYNFYIGPRATVASANQYLLEDVHFAHGRFSNIDEVVEYVNRREKEIPETYLVVGDRQIRKVLPVKLPSWQRRLWKIRIALREDDLPTVAKRIGRWVLGREF
jgi:hypothetical protein